MNKELEDTLNEFFTGYRFRPAPEFMPELNPKNWSAEYKAFRDKYPDDHHKRIFRSSKRYSISKIMTPKDFAKLTKNHSFYRTRDYGMSFEIPDKQYNSINEVLDEMQEWAKSGIWYATTTMINESLQNELKNMGFGVYEYFGKTGIDWRSGEFGGMVKFEPEKHLLTLDEGDVLFGRFHSEGMTFTMRNKSQADMQAGRGVISIIDNYLNGNLRIEEIQKKSYWD